MNKNSKPTIAIVGKGPVGMILAAGLSQMGWPTLHFGQDVKAQTENRTVALFETNLKKLQRFGLMKENDLEQSAPYPLKKLRIIDATDYCAHAPSITFDPQEIGFERFGLALDLNALMKTLENNCKSENYTSINANIKTLKTTPFPHKHTLIDEEGSTHTADIILACDGKNSFIRNELNIEIKKIHYPQTALTFNVTHTKFLDFTSTEIHTNTGPLTFVPIRDDLAAVVWVVTPDTAQDLMKKDNTAFLETLQKASQNLFGSLSSATQRLSWPLSSQIATQFTQNNIYLVGEAAHNFPPIGAQGLNLSMRDCAAILSYAENNTLHTQESQESYHKTQYKDAQERTWGVHALNTSLLNISPLNISQNTVHTQKPMKIQTLPTLRALGLTALKHNAYLRKAAMKAGMKV